MEGTHDDDRIVVTVGEPFTISKSAGYHWFPTLQQIDRQRLFVNIWCSPDEINPAGTRTAFCWTRDGGRTWEPPVPQGDAGHSWARLNDGTSLWLSYQILKESVTTATCRVGRAGDGRSYRWSQGRVDFSPHRIAEGPRGAGSFVFARSILEMADGALLASMYGRFAGDACDRSILVRSADGGATWRFFSTIAYRGDIDGEGLNEPCVVPLAGGDLFAVMRNQSRQPLWTARSRDGGTTWSPLQRMPEYAASVFPDLTRVSNGLLACSFGRPGCHLIFSVDGTGERWTRRTTLFEGPSTCYTAIREVAPDTLLYVHDVTPAGWGELREGQFNEIRGVFVTVKRDGS